MFKEGLLDTTLRQVKKLIPESVFSFFQPYYHTFLSYAGSVVYGFPSRSIKVIGVTGTKGKSTTVYLIAKLLEGAGKPVAMIGSLGYKIKDREWPNTLKMTMPGRFKLQKFLRQAVAAGCEYVVLEVTSEGIKQKRHLGIAFDCAVFTNLHKEHLESHGSFENYRAAKQELFRQTQNLHVINADDPYAEHFDGFPAHKKIYYGMKAGDMIASNVRTSGQSAEFNVYSTSFSIHFGGPFNVYNVLAALATVAMYGVDLPTAKPVLEKVQSIPGRMEFVQRGPFAVVVDYAHTPDSLKAVYETLKSYKLQATSPRLICVLGAAGGGRDKWKRPEFGRIAAEYCDEIILTNEDPYDEDPETILKEIESGVLDYKLKAMPTGRQATSYQLVLDRRAAIARALTNARKNDTVVITGKGSETSIALAGGKKIPWSDRGAIQELLNERGR